MADNPPDRRSLLGQEESDLSDPTIAIAAPTLPYQRHAYRRMNSQGSLDLPSPPLPSSSAGNMEDNEQGLGISQAARSITRVPVGGRASPTPPSPWKPFSPSISTKNSPTLPQNPGSSKQAFSSPPPSWQNYGSGNYQFGEGLGPMLEIDEQDISRAKSSHNETPDNGNVEDNQHQPLNDSNDDDDDSNNSINNSKRTFSDRPS